MARCRSAFAAVRAALLESAPAAAEVPEAQAARARRRRQVRVRERVWVPGQALRPARPMAGSSRAQSVMPSAPQGLRPEPAQAQLEQRAKGRC